MSNTNNKENEIQSQNISFDLSLGASLESNPERPRNNSKEKRSFYIKSIKETDNQIKKLFEDILEERRTTNRTLRENFEKIVTPTNNSISNIFHEKNESTSSFLASNSKPVFNKVKSQQDLQGDKKLKSLGGSGNYENKTLDESGLPSQMNLPKSPNKPFEEKDFVLNDDTSLLLQDGVNEDLNFTLDNQKFHQIIALKLAQCNSDIKSQRQEKTSAKEGGDLSEKVSFLAKKKDVSLSNTKKQQRIKNKKQGYTDNDGDEDDESFDELLNEEYGENKTLNFSLGNGKETLEKPNAMDFNDSKHYALQNELDEIMSPASTNNMLKTLKSVDFNLGGIASEYELKKSKIENRHGDITEFLQFSQSQIDLESAYYTQVKTQTLEVFNKAKENLDIEIQFVNNDNTAEYYFLVGKSTNPCQKDIIPLDKFSHISLTITIKGNLQKKPNVDYVQALRFTLMNQSKVIGSKDISIKARFEAPCLYLSTVLSPAWRNNIYPMIDCLLSSNSKSEVCLPIKNKGSRVLVLEISSQLEEIKQGMNNKPNWEVLYSPKFLSLKPDEESKINITILRKPCINLAPKKLQGENKVIIKAKIKETTLAQCFILSIHEQTTESKFNKFR